MTGPEVLAGLKPLQAAGEPRSIFVPVVAVTVGVAVIGFLTLLAMGNEISNQTNGRDRQEA